MKINVVEKIQQWLSPKSSKNAALFRSLGEKVDSYLFRERLIIIILAFTIIFSVWYFIMFFPTQRAITNYQLQTKIMTQQYEAQKAEYNAIVIQLIGASDQKKQQLLKDEIKRLDESLAKIAQQVVPANQMADMFKDLLIKEGRLTFVSLQSLPAKALVSPEDLAAVDQFSLLEQGMQFTFRGDYFNTLKYLEDIEKSKWRLFWDSLSYKVDKYPQAMVTFTVHTLVQYKTVNDAEKPVLESQAKTETQGRASKTGKKQ